MYKKTKSHTQFQTLFIIFYLKGKIWVHGSKKKHFYTDITNSKWIFNVCIRNTNKELSSTRTGNLEFHSFLQHEIPAQLYQKELTKRNLNSKTKTNLLTFNNLRVDGLPSEWQLHPKVCWIINGAHSHCYPGPYLWQHDRHIRAGTVNTNMAG